MAVVGYDLGNQSCVIARAGRGGVDVLLNGASKRQNACVVSLQGKQRFMGDEASAIARSNFKNTATNFKRLIGRKFAEAEVQEELARMPGVKFVEMPEDGTVGIQVMYNDEPKVLSMEQCMAMMLTKLSAIVAEAEKGKDAADIVLSIPGWYTDAQRVAMLNACTIANMKCVRLLHEGQRRTCWRTGHSRCRSWHISSARRASTHTHRARAAMGVPGHSHTSNHAQSSMSQCADARAAGRSCGVRFRCEGFDSGS